MTNLYNIHVYTTPEHPCSYLEGKAAKTLFIDPHAIITTEVYHELLDLGFRRSGKHIYRPHCDNCNECVSIRVPVAQFKPSKNQRRFINKNADLIVTQQKARFSAEYYDLYARYIHVRHSNGDMYPPTREQFHSFLVEGSEGTHFFEFRTPNGNLAAISVVEILKNGISALYTFYDPLETQRSLGKYCILWLLRHCQENALDYLFLGYWVQGCRKMSYKTDYTPFELLIDGRWQAVTINNDPTASPLIQVQNP